MEMIHAGKTGKSVACSYPIALDLLAPVEASIPGVISNEAAEVTDECLKIIRDRYKLSMAYLASPDDSPGGNIKSKVDTQVQKQTVWAKEVAAYDHTEAQALERRQPPPGTTTAQVQESKEKYMQWIEEHSREAKYMDWVAYGSKFMVDLHLGVVDISSGMKRIENSKEAYRNPTVIAPDGSSEYNGIVLNPSSWATIRAKVLNWKNNSGSSPAQIRAKPRRLQNLLVSHQTLQKAIGEIAFSPVLASNKDVSQGELQAAYAEVYANMDDENKKLLTEKKEGPKKEFNVESCLQGVLALDNLIKRQRDHTEKSLSGTNATVRDTEGTNKVKADQWLGTRTSQLKADIDELKDLKISPSEEALKRVFEREQNIDGEYQQFSSFPAAFVVAADVELSSPGGITKFERAVSALSASASLSVGYGPFVFSGSYSSPKSKSRTKMESAATGCKISVQAPQIVGWVQTLLPQLPKPNTGVSTMTGPFG
ncbi:hypothetical protein F5B21DRAFT_525595 [Xylaria acuta]|nr:hypothetical protein F5B21DRAFT_525595 [Xylaria acuta]